MRDGWNEGYEADFEQIAQKLGATNRSHHAGDGFKVVAVAVPWSDRSVQGTARTWGLAMLDLTQKADVLRGIAPATDQCVKVITGFYTRLGKPVTRAFVAERLGSTPELVAKSLRPLPYGIEAVTTDVGDETVMAYEVTKEGLTSLLREALGIPHPL